MDSVYHIELYTRGAWQRDPIPEYDRERAISLAAMMCDSDRPARVVNERPAILWSSERDAE